MVRWELSHAKLIQKALTFLKDFQPVSEFAPGGTASSDMLFKLHEGRLLKKYDDPKKCKGHGISSNNICQKDRDHSEVR